MDSFFVDLNHLDLIIVSGEDNGKFLQGQLTCDVDALDDLQSCLGAACNNKGRVFSSFRLIKLAENFYVEMQSGLKDRFKTSLDKYIPFYKASLDDASHQFRRIGLVGPDCLAPLAELFPVLPSTKNQVCVSNGHYLIRVRQDAPCFLLWSKDLLNPEKLFPQLRQKPAQSWQQLDIEAGIQPFTVADIDQYTPEELNLDLNGAISFSKGCYTGQEIVARMHYRGKAKKRLYRFHINTTTKELGIGAVILSGQAKSNSQDEEAKPGKKLGKIVSLTKVSADSERTDYEALAILNSQAEQTGQTFSLEGYEHAKLALIPLIY